MTSDILQSDIELATRLRGDQRPDDEIISALTHRGVDPAKAAQLLDDLRNGKNVTGQSALAPELGLRRRSRTVSAAPASGERPPSRSPAAKHRSPSAPPAPRERARSKLSPGLLLALAAVALVLVGFVLFPRSQSGKITAEGPGPAGVTSKPTRTPPQTSAKAAAVTQGTLPTPLVLELQPEGLRLGGTLMRRDSFLPAVYKLLGTPSRTNQVARTGALVYAYDHLGLLIYLQPGGGTNSIVLDCDATGGANGTTSPFAGSLKMDNRVIGPDIASQQLAAIAELGLKHPGDSDTIWNGRYHDVELVFAYLKTPQRPSLIELDLK